ncbi:hypothetical protein ACFVVC_04795 [Pseudarthrobacter sp. NPDC058196]|uniref:hypothetical protein n=1 Tax=Micrococcaceae TaxID=1268 RepID=UPI0006F9EA61|nr:MULTISPECIES: hypothetical protein [unclassified Arthrobacter]KRE65539.1 hypothetical protein ASG79_14370 [Arthrobacter sp. Soil761]TWD56064.1 hypothetical protein FB478_101208 [Arthrobacter sp. AG367]
MSISIGHRAIFAAFGHRYAAPSHAHVTSVQAPSPAAEVTAFEAVPFEAGELKCSPWEGLYLDQARPFTASGDEAFPRRQLDAFLTNLMYGE